MFIIRKIKKRDYIGHILYITELKIECKLG